MAEQNIIILLLYYILIFVWFFIQVPELNIPKISSEKKTHGFVFSLNLIT